MVVLLCCPVLTCTCGTAVFFFPKASEFFGLVVLRGGAVSALRRWRAHAAAIRRHRRLRQLAAHARRCVLLAAAYRSWRAQLSVELRVQVCRAALFRDRHASRLVMRRCALARAWRGCG